MTEVRHKPDAPLPWRVEKCSCGHPVCNSANVLPVTFSQGVMKMPDAEFIAHACNNYEALVQALRGELAYHEDQDRVWSAGTYGQGEMAKRHRARADFLRMVLIDADEL